MVNYVAGLIWIGSQMDSVIRFRLMVLGVRTTFAFVHMTPFADGAVTGRLREQVAAIPYVAWGSAITVCFLWSVFIDKVPVETVHKHCFMQRRLLSMIPFLWLTSTYQAFGRYTWLCGSHSAKLLASSRHYTKTRCLTPRCGTIRS
ncbi:hypothetical protein ARMGADRAFT_442244 [Armillaria gallica]|uniref:Uncharacterized protein n=1 Tax=Armillaria gallica TaxID=47427 RepID=A0A2H3D2X7_ARMGA|nr:hypothetical protein ARMGADRAFT_442244 [Armillaria gallica]